MKPKLYEKPLVEREKELDQIKVLILIEEGKLTLKKGSEVLSLSIRQARRLRRRYEKGGEQSLARISHQLCWKVGQTVFSRFQVILAGNGCNHFQDSHLEYSEKQMFQTFPETCEKCGLAHQARGKKSKRIQLGFKTQVYPLLCRI